MRAEDTPSRERPMDSHLENRLLENGFIDLKFGDTGGERAP
jgi:hypothetical protein